MQFKNLRIEGDPAKLAPIYEEQKADEVVFSFGSEKIFGSKRSPSAS